MASSNAGDTPALEATKRATAVGMYSDRRPAETAGYHIWITSDRGCLGASGSRRARSVRVIERVPTWNGPVGAGTRREVAVGEAAAVDFAVIRSSGRIPGCAARTSLRLRPSFTPRAGPTNASIASPVVAVISATEIEPTVAPPATLRPSEVR